MTEIYLIGTNHISNKSKYLIEKTFKQNNFDCIISEGVKGMIYTEETLIKEPFLTSAALSYSLFLRRFGKDIVTVEESSERYKIPYYNVDTSFQELITYFHRWYNYLIFFLIFIVILKFISRTPINRYAIILIAIIFSYLLYFFYFVLRTLNFRNRTLVTKCREIILRSQYKKFLFVCGKFHAKYLLNNLIILSN